MQLTILEILVSLSLYISTDDDVSRRDCSACAVAQTQSHTGIMAYTTSLDEGKQSVEELFQKVIAQIGGRERIYMVTSEACKNVDGNVIQEFLHDMFYIDSLKLHKMRTVSACKGPIKSSHGETLPEGNENPLSPGPRDLELTAKPVEDNNRSQPVQGDVQLTTKSSLNVSSIHRTINALLIVFIFRQEFFKVGINEACLKEILKDIRARTKRASARPALVGLIRTTVESSESQDIVGVMERLIRAVFHNHPPEAIWVGSFIPKSETKIQAIKLNACKVLCSSQTSDNTRTRSKPLYWPFQCLHFPDGRGARDHGDSSSASRTKCDESLEEAIPLKTFSMATGQHV